MKKSFNPSLSCLVQVILERTAISSDRRERAVKKYSKTYKGISYTIELIKTRERAKL
jgi:hypothetical protein